MIRQHRARATALFFVLAAVSPRAQSQTALTPFGAPPFETYLELLRLQAGIPGMSALVLQDRQVVWERGFGYQDLESRIPATPNTPYLVGDISQTLAAILTLQGVEHRRFALDDRAVRYDAKVEDEATLRQVLSHAAPGEAGDVFKYDPGRYAELTFAVEWCAPQSYRKSVSHRILERLGMADSVPGSDLIDSSVVPAEMWDPTYLDRYRRVLERIAVPYKVDKKGKATRADAPAPEGVSAAAGLVTTVRDLARLDLALEDGILLTEETLAAAWRNLPGKSGLPLPTGLGWFVQTYKGEPVVWHFGVVPNAYSALVIKLPARKMTLILLANSDGLTAPYQLQSGDVTKSVFANLFLRLFT